MMTNECFAMMGALGWLMPVAVALLLGLGIAALIKYLIAPRRSRSDQGDRS